VPAPLPSDRKYTPSTYGESFADVYDDWYHDVSDVEACVAALSRLADGDPVLELGVGTGRLALPLLRTGTPVVGIDASPSMLAVLSRKHDADLLPTYEGDMATIDQPPLADQLAHHGPFGMVFAAFNTFFNLTSDDAQARCLRGAHQLLRPGGWLVIEGFVPPADGLNAGGVSVRSITDDAAVLTVSRHDAATQLIEGHHIDIRADGTRLRPWKIHYRRPHQLDDDALSARFELAHRWRDWDQTPFPEHSIAAESTIEAEPEVHISIYRKPTEGP